ncbi:hypothetical protein AVEN_264865-2-1, partial [Araneus ventricosus]
VEEPNLGAIIWSQFRLLYRAGASPNGRGKNSTGDSPPHEKFVTSLSVRALLSSLRACCGARPGVLVALIISNVTLFYICRFNNSLGLSSLMRPAGQNMFQGVVQFRDPHQPNQQQQLQQQQQQLQQQQQQLQQQQGPPQRFPQQQPKPSMHPQHLPHPPSLSSSSSSSTDSSGGGGISGSATTPPNRRSRRRKSLLYQVLMSPLRKKSGSTNTLNTVGSGNNNNNNTSSQQRQGIPVSNLFSRYYSVGSVHAVTQFERIFFK